MIGQTTILEKSAKAGAAITAYTIAKYGADDDTLTPATASTEDLIGVFQHDAENGKEVRVMLLGISRVKAGGNITRGDLLTSDANGKAVKTADVAGTNYNSIGRALASGVADDIIPVLLSPCRPQG
jgi:hypothetical protein